MKRLTLSRWQQLLAAVLVAGGAAGVVGIAAGSDHQDTPEVELNAKMDMTDVYAFPGSGPGRIVLVMNSRAFLTPGQTPGASFDPDLLYQFKIDNDGDAIEDKVIQVTFSGTGATQKVHVRGPATPPVQGAMMNEVADFPATISGDINTTLGSANNMQVFAGPRDDPFFLDLEQFLCILPDRAPVTGPLSVPCPQPILSWRSAGQAQNYIAGYNVLSIVIELPASDLTAGGTPKLGIWGSISR